MAVPISFSCDVIQPSVPESPTSRVSPERREKNKRRTKKEVKEQGGGRIKQQPNLKSEKEKRKKKVDSSERPEKEWKPAMCYIHYVFQKLSKTEKIDHISQSSQYVQWALDQIIRVHKFFDGYESITVWSDGCAKHFKTYQTQLFLAYSQYLSGLSRT